MPSLEADMRRRIAHILPDAMAKALASYHLFLDEGEQTDPKQFKAHHEACKVAIAHIELLIKLAKWADLPDPAALEDVSNNMLASLIERAQEEIGERS